MKVMVYVEGPSDREAMEAHLDTLIARRAADGISIELFETDGDRKKSLVRKVPVKAARIVTNDPSAIVVALPDLYPPTDGLRTPEDLREKMVSSFRGALKGIGRSDDERLIERFHVFCFKHDLEALVLASEEALAERLGVEKIVVSWTKPVEDQNHDDPPKRVVERLFRSHNQSYHETVDAPLILGIRSRDCLMT